MRNSKKIVSFTLISIFTLLIALNSIPSNAVTKNTNAKANAQVAKATAAVTKTEKTVKVHKFSLDIAQKQLDLAVKEVSKIRLLGKAYTLNYKALLKRNAVVSKKINNRKLAIAKEKAEVEVEEKVKAEAEAERKMLIVEAEKAVAEAEKLFHSENISLTDNPADLVKAQALFTTALEAVVKLDKASKDYTNFMNRIDVLNTILVKTMGEIPAKKPVIYLYPTVKQNVNVKIDTKVHVSCAYPKYNNNGWSITANPDGTIVDEKSGRQYYCLYWEGYFEHNFDLSYGFVVEGKNTDDFLEDSLKKLGLTDKEANEFIIYWLPQLEKNEYNLIHFATEEYNKQAPLEISPKPASLIRILMVYKPLNNSITVKEQQLVTPDRKGFVVIEWGGMEAK